MLRRYVLAAAALALAVSSALAVKYVSAPTGWDGVKWGDILCYKLGDGKWQYVAKLQPSGAFGATTLDARWDDVSSRDPKDPNRETRVIVGVEAHGKGMDTFDAVMKWHVERFGDPHSRWTGSGGQVQYKWAFPTPSAVKILVTYKPSVERVEVWWDAVGAAKQLGYRRSL
jgi:hypothetical protein